MKKIPTTAPLQYTIFQTAFGFAGLVWSTQGLKHVAFPEKTKTKTLERIRAKAPEAKLTTDLPKQIVKLVKSLQEHLAGAQRDFSAVQLDLETVPPFLRKVYEVAQKIPAGQTLSYQELAAKAGSAKASRAAGQAMAKNPMPLIIPCHRVLSSTGQLTGFSVGEGIESKRKLLMMEGSQWGRGKQIRNQRKKSAWNFEPNDALKHLSKADPKLGQLIKDIGPFTLEPSSLNSPFEALLRSIIYQQLAGKAAATILNRLQAIYNYRNPTPDELLKTKPQTLRKAGVSGNKAKALYDLAAKAKQGVVPTLKELETLADEEIIERLSSVRGIGRWTVEMMLIFRLGRPDVLGVDDFALKKSLGLLYGLKAPPTGKEFYAFGEKWRPYRTVASWYLWRALERPVAKEPAPKEPAPKGRAPKSGRSAK